MLDTKTSQELIQSSAELLTKTAELEKDLVRLPILEREKKEASDLAAKLVKEAADQKANFRLRAEQSAETLAKLGFRVDKENFVRALEADPASVFGVIEKIAGDTMVPQIGSGDPSTTGDAGSDQDPLAKFAMG